MGTVISVLVAIFLFYNHVGREAVPNIVTMGTIFIITATFFLFLPVLALTWALSPLQKMEQNLAPRIIELFRTDRLLQLACAFLIFFPLATYLISIDLLYLNTLNKNVLIPLWIVFFGIAIDALYFLVKRIAEYLDPFHALTFFKKAATRSIQNEEELELCNWIESISDVGVKGAARSSTSLSNQVGKELQQVASGFLESTKSISQHKQDPQSKALGINDKVSYTLFFLLQRLEMLNDKAAEQHLEPVCSQLCTSIGKIVFSAAKCDFSLTSAPLQCLGRCSLLAQKNGMPEVGFKSTCTLVEVAKLMLTDIDVTYAELQPTFNSLITQLKEISQELFRHDKNIRIAYLTQPFRDLKELFSSEKMASHQDSPAIVQRIDAVLAEFSALEAVMRTMPPMPDITNNEIG